jgi:phage terminase large subunit-like protein
LAQKTALDPGTAEHFRLWSQNLILDTGEPWEIEGWQLDIAGEVLSGAPITWEVVPEGNGKTTLSAGLGLYHLDPEGQGHQAPMVVVAASTSKQAEWMYIQAAGFVQRSPALTDRFRCLGGFKRIERQGDKLARMDVFAGDDKAADGAIFTLAFVDELHRHKDLRLYRIWRGKLSKRQGQILVTSTAGEPNSEFEDARAKILDTATKLEKSGEFDSHIRAESGKVVLHDWGVRDRDTADETAVVLEANPFSGVSKDDIEEKRDDPTTTWDHFLRFSCNIATRVEGQAITPEVWDNLCDREISPSSNSWKVGFLDLGWEIDTTAMGILAWESFELRIIAGVRILEPPVDEADIVRGLVHLQQEFAPQGWVFDRSAGGGQMAQLLDKGEHPHQEGAVFQFIEHSQDNAPMSRAAVRLDEAIRNGWIRHDGHEGLRAHMLNVVRRSLGGERWKFDRPPDAKGRRRKKFPIDAATGVLMGHNYAVDAQTTDKQAFYIL